MTFHLINLLYIGIWLFNGYAFILAKAIDDFMFEDTDKTSFRRFLSNHQNTISGLLKITTLGLIFISIFLIVISLFFSLEVSRLLIAIYFIVSFIDLLITAVIMTMYKGK